jgi:NADPH-dependent 2,4-dienoyl-CoA reductase/sulfur reductase-like enzyme
MKPPAFDLIVIRAGPAGLASAIRAKESGIDKVMVIERGEYLGGLLDQCIHTGFGLQYFKEDLTGPEYARRFIEKMEDLKIQAILESMVLRIDSDKTVTFSNKKGVQSLQAKSIILAMGCRERPRESLRIPGTRPSGILTAGTAQRYVNVDGYIPGGKVVILGSGDVGMIMARRLTIEGAEVKAVVEILPWIGGLIRNEVQCLKDFNIPLYLSHTVSRIYGKDRVRGVTIAKVDRNWNPISGTEKEIDCDTLLISAGLVPENELSRQAGIKIDPLTKGPMVSEMLETSIPGIFACGNVLHVHDLVDNVTLEAEKAGVNAAAYVTKRMPPLKQIPLKPGENIRYTVPQSVSGKENVTIYTRVKEPRKKAEIRVGNIFKKTERVVAPSQMIAIRLTPKEFGRFDETASELVISCNTKGA